MAIPNADLCPDTNHGNFADDWLWLNELPTLFQFVALTETGRHEYTAPGPTLADAYRHLETNAVPMTGISARCWHFVRSF